MANHVENSLADLLSDPSFKIGEIKKSGDFAAPDIDQLRAQVRILEGRRLKEADGSVARRSVELQITTLNAEIKNKLAAAPGNTTSRTTSMFDEVAVVDYARYVSSNPWEDNLRKKDAQGDLVRPYQFLRNNNGKMNTVVPGDNTLKANDYNDGLSILNIIRWSEDYPALQLRFQDFVYCKFLNVYPNNRLLVLRKFRNGVPDNLFDHFRNDEDSDNAHPLATLVTWANPKDTVMSMSFNEVWTTDKGSFFSKPEAKKADDSFFNMSLYNLGDNTLLFSLLDYLDDNQGNGLSSSDGVGMALNEPGGNPNLIRNAALRKTGGEGLASKIRFQIAFDFQWQMIANIDPNIAMLDLLSNCMHMGSSTAQFRMDFAMLKGKSVQKILNGQFEIEFETFFSSFKAKAEEIFDVVTTSITAIATRLKTTFDSISSSGGILNEAGNAVDTTAKHVISAFREKMKNALYSETGLPGGVFHVTFGNPKNPVISCGDLIISDSNVELGAEMSLQDFPTSFKYTITLESARERGRNELERIFNAGRGRVYVYPSAADNADYHINPHS